MAYPERFELPTSWSVAKRSIQLSYGYALRKAQSVAFGGAVLNLAGARFARGGVRDYTESGCKSESFFMRWMGCVWAPVIALAAALIGVAATQAAEPGMADDFNAGLAQWECTDANAWEIVEESDGNKALGLVGASKYSPPVRSPLNIALLKGRKFGSFEMTVKMKQTGREYGHRDLCLFFGYVAG